jgi:uncharacterized RDD family membrane protein YckC
MQLYYSDGDRKMGPIGKTELQALIKEKRINAQTLVWQPGMEAWQRLGALVRKRSDNVTPQQKPVPLARPYTCAECGHAFSQDEVIHYQDSWVCGGCKPIFVQKIKEGVSVSGAQDYAGFWIRFAAISIDGLILWLFNMILFIPMGILVPASFENPFVMLSFMPILILIQYAVPAAYDTWFVGKYGATPGKMACKLKIADPDGEPLSYLRAFGRHFAKWLSSMTLLIGFIMAAFDEEKRSLHDRVCETRVIRN